jgi:hypothetical protein
MLSRRLAAARLGRGAHASGGSRRRSGGRCCGGAAGRAWRRRSSGRRRSTLASALEQPSARSTLRLPQRTRTRRPPARDRPQPRSCIRGKAAVPLPLSRSCSSIVRRRRRRATHALLLSRECESERHGSDISRSSREGFRRPLIHPRGPSAVSVTRGRKRSSEARRPRVIGQDSRLRASALP